MSKKSAKQKLALARNLGGRSKAAVERDIQRGKELKLMKQKERDTAAAAAQPPSSESNNDTVDGSDSMEEEASDADVYDSAKLIPSSESEVNEHNEKTEQKRNKKVFATEVCFT